MLRQRFMWKLRNVLSDRHCPCCEQFKVYPLATLRSQQMVWQCATSGLVMVIDPGDPYSFSIAARDFVLAPGEYEALERLVTA